MVFKSGNETKSVAVSKLVEKTFGIPASKQSPAVSPLRSRLIPYIDLLGKVTDAEIGQKVGISHQGVAHFRSRLKIPGLNRSGIAREKRDAKALEIGDRLKNTASTALAKELNMSPITVAKIKEEHGIPTYRTTFGSENSKSKLLSFKHLLGKVSDPQVAKLANVSAVYVTTYRNRFGIPPLHPDRSPLLRKKG